MESSRHKEFIAAVPGNMTEFVRSHTKEVEATPSEGDKISIASFLAETMTWEKPFIQSQDTLDQFCVPQGVAGPNKALQEAVEQTQLHMKEFGYQGNLAPTKLLAWWTGLHAGSVPVELHKTLNKLVPALFNIPVIVPAAHAAPHGAGGGTGPRRGGRS